MSQYFSISTAPPTSNNISLAAMLPQLTQNFGFSVTLTKDLDNEKTFSNIVSPLQILTVEPYRFSGNFEF
jgi:hypothetical protein